MAVETRGSGTGPQSGSTGFNGATAFRRWIRQCGGDTGALDVLLQWGHRLSAMDTGLLPAAVHAIIPASMVPPPFGDGYDAGSHHQVRVRATLQWGHRLSAMDTQHQRKRRVRTAGFNGATAFRRWIRAAGRSPLSSSRCFNGATAFRRWIPRWPRPDTWTPATASMGPPPFGDGYISRRLRVPLSPQASMGPPPFGDGFVANLVDRLAPGFNGATATAFRRWIRCKSC